MSKIPKFLICTNPMFSEENQFILCTSKPEMLIRVVREPGKRFQLEIERVFSGTEDQIEGALARAHDWFIAYSNKMKTGS